MSMQQSKSTCISDFDRVALRKRGHHFGLTLLTSTGIPSTTTLWVFCKIMGIEGGRADMKKENMGDVSEGSGGMAAGMSPCPIVNVGRKLKHVGKHRTRTSGMKI